MDHEPHRRTLQPRIRLSVEHLWTLLPLFTVAWMGLMHPIRLLDFWWHLKAGQVIWETRTIPSVDSFSFTRAGQPFAYAQYWLSEISYYFTLRAGGLPLVIAFNSLLLVLSMWLVLRLCLQANDHRRTAVLCGMVTALVLGLYGNVRPQLYSIVLFVVFYWIVWQFRERRRDLLWMLPPLMALWVNLHGAFLLGIGLLGLVWGCEIVRRVLRPGGNGTGKDVLEPAALLKLGLVLVLTTLACLLNPVGVRMLNLARELQANPSVQLFVAEWQIPDIHSPEMLLSFYAPLFMAIWAFIYSPRRLNLTELALFLAFSILGLQARRNSIWFVLVITPLLARHLVGVEATLGLHKWLRRPRMGTRAVADGRVAHSRSWPAWLILAFLVAFTVVLSPWVRPRLGAARLRPQLVDKATPVGAMDYIAANHLMGNIFHPQEYGDYMIWRLWPQQRSFIDGRVHLFGEAFLQAYVLTFRDPNWEARLAQYDIRYLLLPRADADAAALLFSARSSAHWTLLYEDSVSVLLEKRPCRSLREDEAVRFAKTKPFASRRRSRSLREDEAVRFAKTKPFASRRRRGATKPRSQPSVTDGEYCLGDSTGQPDPSDSER